MPFTRCKTYPYAKFCCMLALCLLTLVACSTAPQTVTQPTLSEQATVATQNSEGLVVVAASQFQRNIPRGKYSWQLQQDANTPVGTALVALPDIQGGFDMAPQGKSPQLNYSVRFVKSGTHYIWLYGQAPAQAPLNGDSIHVGLNGSAPASAARIGDFKTTYGWINLKMSGGPATLNIAKPGIYIINVWMREDGARFSAIALSNNPAFRPTQANLPTPPTLGEAPRPEEEIPAPTINSTPAAFSATALRNSVGVNIHATYTDTTYYDNNRLLAYLKDLDVTWIRDGIKETPSISYLSFLQNAADSGFRINLIVGDPLGRYGQFGSGEQDQFVQALKTIYKGRFHQLEGPNEWDAAVRDNTLWPGQLKKFYAEYRTSIRAEPSLNGIRFIGGSMAQGFNFPYYTDYNQEAATLHPYPGGEMPEISRTDRDIAYARESAGDKPIIATEVGYNNAINTRSGHVGVPEDVAAHYILRKLIYNYAEGIEQNYIYQLFDQKPNDPQRTNIEEWFGLVAVEGNPDRSFQTSWTLRKKPAYFAVKRFQAYLQDLQGINESKNLPYEITSLPQNALAFPISRNDGSYDIAIWLKNSLWDTRSRTVLADSSATVSFNFASSVNVSSFRPSVSDAITRIASVVTELSVPIDGKVTFLRVSPR